MESKVFDTEQEAKDYSAKEAVSRGCSGATLYWYDWSEGVDGKWYCPALPRTDSPE